MAERHGRLGHYLARNLADARLVRAVHIGVDQADGDRFDPGCLQQAQLVTDIGFIERAHF